MYTITVSLLHDGNTCCCNPASPVRLAHQTTNTFQPFNTTAAKLFPWQHEVTTPSQAAASAGV